ncbi:MAG: DUF1420 family protein [Acidobacteriota bacterium]
MPVPFLRLDALLLAPPWSAAMALLIVLSVFVVAVHLARHLDACPGAPGLGITASFVLTTATLAACVQALALLGAATPRILRVVGGILLAAGSLGVLRSASQGQTWDRARACATDVRRLFAGAEGVQRWTLAASAFTGMGLTLAAFGPPTDIDSLAYHLSVPLDWLAHGGMRATPDWPHARLVGAGELINMLGLAMGTDCLGPVFQTAGLFVASSALISVAATTADAIFGLALVAGCPLLPFLVLTSKPQLLPAAATSVALALYVWHRRTHFARVTAGTLCAIFGALAFAAACKYSCLPASGVLVVLTLQALWPTRWRRAAVLAAITAFAVIAGPVYLRNWLFYGDALSPVLEGARHTADPVVQAFAWYLRNFAGGRTLGHLARLPVELVVARSPGQLTSVLGVGALAAAVSVTRRRENWPVVASATIATLAGVAFSQLAARFFLEPYLWFGLAAVLAPWTHGKAWLFVLVATQMTLTSAVATYSVVHLAPAALTAKARDHTLNRFAADYTLARWLDGVLPADAHIAVDRRSALFLTRPTALHGDFAQMLAFARLSDADKRARLQAALSSSGATVLVLTAPVSSSPFASLAQRLGPPTLVSPMFPDAVRNPWREAPAAQVFVFDLRQIDGALREESR